MKSLAVLAMATLLLTFFFQCCPSSTLELPPIQVPTEEAGTAPGEPPEETSAAPPATEVFTPTILPTPTDTATPAPTQTPLPTPTHTPSPTPTTAPVPAKLEFGGHGDTATPLFRLGSGLVRSNYACEGGSNCIIELLDAEGSYVSLLANDIAPCSGSRADNVGRAGGYLLSVNADASWTITLEAYVPSEGQAPHQPSVAVDLSGSSDAATQVFHLEGGLVVSDYACDGDSNCIMELLDAQGDYVTLLANDIAPCSGSRAGNIPNGGDYLLSVNANGNWSISLAQ